MCFFNIILIFSAGELILISHDEWRQYITILIFCPSPICMSVMHPLHSWPSRKVGVSYIYGLLGPLRLYLWSRAIQKTFNLIELNSLTGRGFRLTEVHGAVLPLAFPATPDPPTLPTIPCRGKKRTGEVRVSSLWREAESLTDVCQMTGGTVGLYVTEPQRFSSVPLSCWHFHWVNFWLI